jgi:hypothetical protein
MSFLFSSFFLVQTQTISVFLCGLCGKKFTFVSFVVRASL